MTFFSAEFLLSISVPHPDMKLLILFSIFSLVSAYSSCGIRIAKSINARTRRFERSIIGGNNVTNSSKWPWQVYVRELHNCGGCIGLFALENNLITPGTVISNQWVLTAAHCVESGDASNVTVTAGITTRTDKKETPHNAAVVYVHPGYDNKTVENDIALVKLETPLDYSDIVSPICLPAPAQLIPRDGQAVVTGFGRSNDTIEAQMRSKTMGNCAKRSFQSFLPNERWNNLPPVYRDDDEGKIIIETWSRKKIVCAGSRGHSATNGDSGGPLMMRATDGRWFQIGIVSFGVPDPLFEYDIYPGVYTDIRKYCEWIKLATNGEASCQGDEVTLEDVEINA